jgi:hypothetical protein
MPSRFPTESLKKAISLHRQRGFAVPSAINSESVHNAIARPSQSSWDSTASSTTLAELVDFQDRLSSHGLKNQTELVDRERTNDTQSLQPEQIQTARGVRPDDEGRSKISLNFALNQKLIFQRQSLSKEELNNISIRFANTATDYLRLGHMYLQAQVKEEGTEINAPEKLFHPWASRMFGSVCITDSCAGNPIRLRSKDFALGSAGLVVGACDFLNLPGGCESGCTIWTHTNDAGVSRFVLLLWTPLLGIRSGHTKAIVASQTDITKVVQDLAMQELWQNVDTRQTSKDSEGWTHGDWLDLASAESVDVGNHSRFSDRLAPPGRLLRRFLSFVHRLVSLHSSYIVFVPAGANHHQSVEPRTPVWSPRLISHNLYRKKPAQLQHTPKSVRHSISCSMEKGIPFQSKYPLGKDVMALYGMPVSDGRVVQQEQLNWCVCFLVNSHHEDYWSESKDEMA